MAVAEVSKYNWMHDRTNPHGHQHEYGSQPATLEMTCRLARQLHCLCKDQENYFIPSCVRCTNHQLVEPLRQVTSPNMLPLSPSPSVLFAGAAAALQPAHFVVLGRKELLLRPLAYEPTLSDAFASKVP